MIKDFEVVSFDMLFEGLTTSCVNLEARKIMIECEYLRKHYICKWGKTTKNGTRATFVASDADAVIARLNELWQFTKDLNKNNTKG